MGRSGRRSGRAGSSEADEGPQQRGGQAYAQVRSHKGAVLCANAHAVSPRCVQPHMAYGGQMNPQLTAGLNPQLVQQMQV
jgi:hypothetical protein